MCGAFQQEDDNKLDKEAANRMKDAENIGVLQSQLDSNNSYGQFLNDASNAPINILVFVKNKTDYNKRLNNLMEQENF